MAKNTSVIGIYTDRTTVSEAINVLQKVGFRSTDISVLLPDNGGSKDFGHEKHSKAPEGAAIGAIIGVLVGAALAWVISTRAVIFTGLAPLASIGPVLAAFVGAGAGSVIGWMVGLLVGFSFSEYVAKRYVGRIRRGGILMSVHCDNSSWCARAKKALRDSGAQNISSARETGADYATSDIPTERVPPAVATVRVQASDHPMMRSLGETRGMWHAMRQARQ